MIVEEVDMIELIQTAVDQRARRSDQVQVVGVGWVAGAGHAGGGAFVIQLEPENGPVDFPNPSHGGIARAAKLSPARRSEIARNAAKARWKKEGKT